MAIRRRATSADATSCSPQGKRSSLQPIHRQMHSWRRHSGQRLCTEFSGRTFQHPRAQVHSVALHGAGGRAIGSSSYSWKFPTQSVLLDVSDGASSSYTWTPPTQSVLLEVSDGAPVYLLFFSIGGDTNQLEPQTRKGYA